MTGVSEKSKGAQAAGQGEGQSGRVRHLLAVARRAFVTQGFAATSIDAIARSGGVSKETIYRHFPDKEALFRAALEEMAVEFSRRTEQLHEAGPAPEVELPALARAILDSAIEGGLLNPVRAAIEVASAMPDFSQELQSRQWQRLEPVRRALEAYARAAGVQAAVPLDLAVDFGSLAVEGPRLLMGFAPPEADDRGRIAEAVATIFERGVAAVRDAPELTDVEVPPVAERADHIEKLLAVTIRHGLRHGYEGASLDEIAGEARVGRGTLYRHFGSKAGLFDAALGAAAMQAARRSVLTLPEGKAETGALAAYLEAALLALAEPMAAGVQQFAIADARRNPALARAIHAIVREPWIAPLAHWYRSLPFAAVPRPGQARWLAAQSLVLAHRGNRLFTPPHPLGPAEAADQAGRAAGLLMNGFLATLRPA